MNFFTQHGRDFFEPVLLALVSGWLGVRADGYWSAFLNATGVAALWVIPAMYFDVGTHRDAPGIGYIATAPLWGLFAVLIRGVVHLVFRMRGRSFPATGPAHPSWLVVVPSWLGRKLGHVYTIVFQRGKE